jgi:hypothetical protein
VVRQNLSRSERFNAEALQIIRFAAGTGPTSTTPGMAAIAKLSAALALGFNRCAYRLLL